MAQIRTLKLNLLADVSKFGAGMVEARGDVNKLSISAQRAGKAVSAAFAGMGVAAGYAALRIGKEAVAAAMEDQAAQVQLAGTLKNTTKATDAQIASVERWITAQQFAYGVSDNQLRKGLERLTRSTEDVTEAQRLSTLAINISAKTGKDYETVVMGLAKANDGQLGALKKLGITLGDNAENAKELVKYNTALAKAQNDAQLALEEYGAASDEYQKAQEKVAKNQEIVNQLTAEGADWVGELEKQFAGSASAAAATYAGQLKIVNERIGELKESAGNALLPVLGNLLKVTNQVALGFSGGSASLADSMSAVTREGYYSKTGGENLGTALKNVADNTSKLFSVLQSDGDKSSSILNGLAKALNLYADALGAVADNAERTKKWAEWLSKGGVLGSIARAVVDKVANQPQRAAGGSVSAGMAYTVGEFGRETFIPNTSGRIVPNGGNGGVNITINGAIDPEGVRRQLEKLLQDSARRSGSISLVGATL